MSTPIENRFYRSPSTGRTFGLCTSWRPDDCVIETKGWTVEHPDGTTGLGHPPFATREDAQAWCDAHPRFSGMSHA